MASVDDFLIALDDIEAEMREFPIDVHAELSVSRGRMPGGTGKCFHEYNRYVVLLSSRSVRTHWDQGWFDIGGPEFPFVWSLEDSSLHRSLPQELLAESEDAELAVWHYLDASRTPLPENMPAPDHSDPHWDTEAMIAWGRVTDLDRFWNLYDSLRKMWTLAPDGVLQEFGDLSRLPIGPALPAGVDDDLCLWWPTVLFYLALRQDVVVLSAGYGPCTDDSFSDGLAATPSEEQDEFVSNWEPSTWSIRLQPSSVLGATTHALRAFRRVAEDSVKVRRSSLTTDTSQSGGDEDADEPAIDCDAPRCDDFNLEEVSNGLSDGREDRGDEPTSDPVAGKVSSSVEDFRWRLDAIEIDLRRLPQNLCVLLTHTPLTREGSRYSMFECEDRHRLGTHWLSEGDLPDYPLVGQPPDRFPYGTDRFPFGVVLSRTSSLLELAVDAAERTWLTFGGKCGFYVSGDTVRGSLPEGEVAYELTERIIWHYFDENTGDPIPKASSFESVYKQLLRCYRGISEACRDLEDLVSLGGDELTPVIYELEWPEGLLYLGLKNSPPSLRVERGLLARSLPGEELIPFGDETGECHDVFRICPSSVARATSYALKALRRMVHAVDAPAAGGEATPEDPRVPSRSITAYDDEVKRAAKEDFHPSVDFLEPLSREIESIIDSDSCIGKDKLHALRMLFWNLTNAEVRLYFNGNPDWEIYRSDARPPAWERARAWLLAARLTALCDDFKDRTVRQREAIESLWQAVNFSPGRQLTADDFIDLELDAYLDTLKSLSLTLRQHTPVTTTTQTPHGAAAGGDDDNRQPPAVKPADAAVGQGTPTDGEVASADSSGAEWFVDDPREDSPNERKLAPARHVKGLTPKQQRALELIRKHDGPIKGVLLARKLEIEESTLRKHYIPVLKGHGVKNNGDGYYIDSE